MKRLKKPTVLSMVLMSVGIFMVLLLFYTGSILIGGAGLVLFVIGLRTRKRETFEEYKDRYNEKYGIEDENE